MGGPARTPGGITFPTTWFIVTIGSASYALYRLQNHLTDRQRRLLTPLIHLGEIIDLILNILLFIAYRLLHGRLADETKEEAGEPSSTHEQGPPPPDPLFGRLEAVPTYEPAEEKEVGSLRVILGEDVPLTLDRRRLN